MASTWLCQRKTSKYLYVLVVLTMQVTRTHAAQTHAPAAEEWSSSSSSSTKPQEQHNVEHQQSHFIDDTPHERFADHDSVQPHSRKKRLIWITDDGRLALPPGTSLTFTPTIALPLVRHPPEGFFSNLTISFPVTIDFDKLGLTDNQNPLGDLPPIFARSFEHTAGKMLGQYVSRYLHYRRKRDLKEESQPNFPANSGFVIKEERQQQQQQEKPTNEFPQLPERLKHVFHGGERVLLYGVLEDFLSTFGMNGKACLLRTICEVHSRNLDHFGVFGEIAKLFLTVTKSPFSDLIPDFVQAQEIGEGRQAPGECFPYYKECPKGLFKDLQRQKYSDPSRGGEYHEQEAIEILPQGFVSNTLDPEEIETNQIKLRSRREKFLM